MPMNIPVSVSFTGGVISDQTPRKILRNEKQNKWIVKTYDTQRLPKNKDN